MTLKNKRKNRTYTNYAKHLIGLSNKNKRARIFIGLAKAVVKNVIFPFNFLESFALTSFEMQ